MWSFVWLFSFKQSKNNAVLEPKTGHFRGLVGIKAKALKMCRQGRPRGQGQGRI